MARKEGLWNLPALPLTQSMFDRQRNRQRAFLRRDAHWGGQTPRCGVYETDFNDTVEFLHTEFTAFGYRKGLVRTGPQK